MAIPMNQVDATTLRQSDLADISDQMADAHGRLMSLNSDFSSILGSLYGEGSTMKEQNAKPHPAGMIGTLKARASEIAEQLERAEAFVKRLRSLA